MKIVLSPAKSLDFETKLPTSRGTQPQFLDTAIKINRKMSRMSKDEVSKLMDISDKLADLNYGRYKDFQEEHTKENSRPAMYAFNGDVYTGLDAYSLPIEKLDFIQERLRILSGLYGVLKPLDIIQPYRLEMGTSVGLYSKKNLYEIWQKKITDFLNKEMQKEELFINLASNEYFKAVDSKKLKARIITPVFKDFSKGKLKIVSFFAKKARGSMVRFIVDKEVETVEELKGFDYDGYKFSEAESSNNTELVFIR
ncbi:peroxide stress protein YaaA [Gillisia sp. CAL575]|uniref:peroxide stress protein YaaA n=1 Tax=Gillisia sp. CAL575 TaxID=985255 RepID=UPI0003A0147D|nr:peroxide stress protein YaaA [Gillisia sp. CAL575]